MLLHLHLLLPLTRLCLSNRGGLIAIIVLVHAVHFFIWQKGTWQNYQFGTAWFLLPYFGSLWVMAQIGPAELGGSNLISFLPVMGMSALASLIVFYLAISTSLSHERIQAVFKEKIVSAA